jgi:hypothetical protein
MTFPWKYYTSDAHQLLSDLMRDDPTIAEEKKKGLALWWDRKMNDDELTRVAESRVEQQPYVYQTKG